MPNGYKKRKEWADFMIDGQTKEVLSDICDMCIWTLGSHEI